MLLQAPPAAELCSPPATAHRAVVGDELKKENVMNASQDSDNSRECMRTSCCGNTAQRRTKAVLVGLLVAEGTSMSQLGLAPLASLLADLSHGLSSLHTAQVQGVSVKRCVGPHAKCRTLLRNVSIVSLTLPLTGKETQPQHPHHFPQP